MRIRLVGVVALVLTDCAIAAVAVSKGGQPRSIYIVDASLLTGQSGAGRWPPTMGEAIAARTALRNYLRDNRVQAKSDAFIEARNRAAVSSQFDSYTMQVEGVRAASNPQQFYDTEGFGPKQIHVNAVCASARGAITNLSSEQMAVSDGGNCFFTALYDLNSKRIVMFMPGGR